MALTNQMQENMERAQKRDAVQSEQFYFRTSIFPDYDDNEGAEHRGSHDHECTEMSIDSIINGKVCSISTGFLYCITWNGLRMIFQD